MKNYRLSEDYKDFMSKVGNRYKEDYIERHDPNDEIPPVTVKENVYPIEHVYALQIENFFWARVGAYPPHRRLWTYLSRPFTALLYKGNIIEFFSYTY